MVLMFLEAWLVTLAMEVPVLMILLRKYRSLPDLFFCGLAASSLTLPWLWMVMPRWLDHNQLLVWGELLVVAVETGILAGWLKLPWLWMLGASLLANAVSLFLGSWLVY